MCLQIDYTETEAYLEVSLQGMLTDENNQRAVREIIDRFCCSSHHRLLVDEYGLQSHLSFLSNYEAGKLAAGMLRNKRHRVAIVSRDDLVENDRFFETVAVNHGSNIRVFIEKSDALQWLINPQPEP
jgi:hypothetical protein